MHSSAYVAPTIDCITVPLGPNVARLRVGPIANNFFLAMEFTGIFPTDAIVVDPTNVHPIAFNIDYVLFGNTLASGHITSVTAVPEPMAALLVAGGVLAALRRRQSAGVFRSKPITAEALSQRP